MSYNDIIGTVGVGLILIAYFCNIFGMVAKNGKLFFIMNVIGAGLACYASLLINYWPFVILEAAWAGVSIVALARAMQIQHDQNI
jgi:hypothetical protein